MEDKVPMTATPKGLLVFFVESRHHAIHHSGLETTVMHAKAPPVPSGRTYQLLHMHQLGSYCAAYC